MPSYCDAAPCLFWATLMPSCALVCLQGVGSAPEAVAVRNAARSYVNNQATWDATYRSAYLKMVSTFATWSQIATTNPVYINGGECASGTHLEAACAQASPGLATADTKVRASYAYLTTAGFGHCCVRVVRA